MFLDASRPSRLLCGGISASFIVSPPPFLPWTPVPAFGSTSAPKKARASCRTSSNSAIFFWRKAGAWARTFTMSASKAQSIMKRPGPRASDPFCNFSSPRKRPQHTPPYFGHPPRCLSRAIADRGRNMDKRPLTILCVSSYEKGQEFLRTCKALGCRVYLLTVEKLRHADWPHEAIDEMFFMPDELPLPGLLNAVSYAARIRKINRIVALDEFDMENVSAIREHLRIPGMGLTTVRYFRDKLAMRARAKEAGVNVPEFVHVLNYDELREFMARVPAPWLLKPRSQASGIGMKKLHQPG